MNLFNQILAGLFGLLFVVFGLNFFVPFLPIPPMEGDAGTFMGILFSSKYLAVVKGLEIALGALILLNIKRSLALVMILPITINIVLFHVLLAGQPQVSLVFLAMNLYLMYVAKDDYADLLL